MATSTAEPPAGFKPIASSASSTLHLFPSNTAPTPGNQNLSENMVVSTEIIATYKQFEQEPLSTTFRPCIFTQMNIKDIKHLPGDFHISKKGNVSQSGSLKRVVLGPEFANSPQPPPQPPITFHALNFLQLESAFTLQDGGYVKKRKKNRKSSDPENPDGQKKKRKKDNINSSGETKKKRKKKDKEVKPELKEVKA